MYTSFLLTRNASADLQDYTVLEWNLEGDTRIYEHDSNWGPWLFWETTGGTKNRLVSYSTHLRYGPRLVDEFF